MARPFSNLMQRKSPMQPLNVKKIRSINHEIPSQHGSHCAIKYMYAAVFFIKRFKHLLPISFMHMYELFMHMYDDYFV